MRIIGLSIKSPSMADMATALMIAAITCVAAVGIRTIIGGGNVEVAALTAAGFASSLLSACGAAYRGAGLRGLVLSVVVAALVYGAVVGLAGKLAA